MRVFRGAGAAQGSCCDPKWFLNLHGPYRDFFAAQCAALSETVLEINQDGLTQLLPIVLASGQTPAALRAQIGRAAWRKIHHATETTNFMRSLVWLRYQPLADWPAVIALPEAHLRSCRNALDWDTANFAAHRAAPGKFSQIAMLYRDTVKMGGAPDPGWSIRRLKKEHDTRAVDVAIESADPTPWAQPFTYRSQGYVFDRLISDRDFVAEGKAQRNCVATFRDDARAGDCVVMRCTGTERATFKFGAPDQRELSGFAGSAVTPLCAKIAAAVETAYKLTIL